MNMVNKHIPNILSFFRLILIAPFIMTLYNGSYAIAFYILLTAGITDGFDGWLARQYNWQTPLGHMIDPLADKLLVATSFISLALLQQLPWWLVILVFARDLTIFFGALAWYYLISKTDEFVPTLLSKINTVLQIVLVNFSLGELAFFRLTYDPIPLLIFLTALTTAITFSDYVWTWGKKACAIKRA